MKNVVMHIDDVLDIFERLKADGTEAVMFLTHDGFPAIIDAENPEALYVFKSDEDVQDDEVKH